MLRRTTNIITVYVICERHGLQLVVSSCFILCPHDSPHHTLPHVTLMLLGLRCAFAPCNIAREAWSKQYRRVHLICFARNERKHHLTTSFKRHGGPEHDGGLASQTLQA